MLHHPKTRADWLALRVPVITSTEAPALFEESPYLTHFELYHQKHDNVIVDFEPSDRMIWGTRLQDVIARGIAEDYGVKVRKLTAFATADDCRIGASFDFEIVGLSDTGCRDSVLRDLYAKHGAGVLEVKNVDGLVHRKDWQDDQAPAHIEIQAQHQLEVLDREWSVIGALVGGNRAEILIRMRDREVGAGLRVAANAFWARVAADLPPAPDFLRDADALRKIYGFSEPGKLFDGRGNDKVASLCAAYTAGIALEKSGKDAKDAARSELLTLIGSSEKVITDGYSISAGMLAPVEVKAHTREARRDFRVFEKKAKEKAA